MPQPFAPNNNSVAKFLFTGRTKDLDEIFNYLLAGNSVALYGERRGGKTLTLEVIEAIINHEIYSYKYKLVDQTFVAALPIWKHKLTDFKALFVSLQGTRKESEILSRLTDRANHLDLIPKVKNNNLAPETVADWLALLQMNLRTNGQRLVILMDEMEVLGQYPEEVGSALAEDFANAVAYPNISYVHAGSYRWRDRVYTPGSNFTHLEAKYLSVISETDIRDVLLHPLSSEDQKSLIASFTGGKPLYAQYLGKAVYERHPLTEKDLLESSVYTSFREQIERNIFKEKGLDESSQKLLAALAYHPNVSKKWLATKLRMNEVDVANRLNQLDRFGTIEKSVPSNRWQRRFAGSLNKLFNKRPEIIQEYLGERYVIVGKFIEIYGRAICDDPTRKGYGHAPKGVFKQLVPVVRWAVMIVMIGLAVSIFLYTHPDTETKTFPIPNASVSLDIPGSVEVDEVGTLLIAVANKSSQPLEAFRVSFHSDKIRFNKSGSNSISFAKIEAGETRNEEINYQVISTETYPLESTVSVANHHPFSFHMNCRQIQIKKYSMLLMSLLALSGLLIPWKSWGAVIGLVKDIFPGGKH